MERETKILLVFIIINTSIIIPLITLSIIWASIIWGLELINITLLSYYQQQRFNNIIKTKKEIIEQ